MGCVSAQIKAGQNRREQSRANQGSCAHEPKSKSKSKVQSQSPTPSQSPSRASVLACVRACVKVDLKRKDEKETRHNTEESLVPPKKQGRAENTVQSRKCSRQAGGVGSDGGVACQTFF